MTFRIVKETWGDRTLFSLCQIIDGKAQPVTLTADNPAWFKTMARQMENAVARGPIDESEVAS